MKLKRIGKIEIDNKGPKVKIDKRYINGLNGLKEFSHCIILWWADKNDNETARSFLEGRPPFKSCTRRLGVFSIRSPKRPNPICLNVVKILSIKKDRTIFISHTDAEHNTPVIDIKPYIPSADRVNDFKLPHWCAHWPSSIEGSNDFNWQKEHR